MAPGVDGLPGALGPEGREDADDRVDVGATVADYLQGLPTRTVRRIGLAIRALEWLPFPWRFSHASLEARQELLAKLDDSGSGLVRDLLLFMKVLTGLGFGNDRRVRLAIGYEARCAVAEGDAGGREAPLGDLVPHGDGEDCDVAIVGSGAGGAVAATV